MVPCLLVSLCGLLVLPKLPGLLLAASSSDTTEVSLGWCPSPIRQPFLCVTFPTVAYILSHQRRNYFHIDPLWIPICKTSPQPYTNLNAALWIGNETLISASGPYLTLHRPAFRQRKQSVSLVEATHRHNGQLPLYHPQFLAQCLSAGKPSVLPSRCRCGLTPSS